VKTARKIVIIMTDTQRTDMLGCYGNKDMKTPNIDRLAKEGCRFDRAYTCQPVCGPARSAIFSGTYPHSNGSWGNHMALGDNVKTIGQRLRDEGIHTAYIGKWHLDGGDYFGMGRCPDGWDPNYWYDMRCYLEELPEEDRRWSRRKDIVEKREVKEDFTYGHRCSNRAIDFLSCHGADDFLLVVSYDEPHGPFVCPEPYSSMYKGYEFPKSPNVYDILEGKPEHQKVWAGKRLLEDKEKLKIKRHQFFGCNSFVDYEIGRVMEAIEQYAPDAMVIYTSDHGDALCSHSLDSKGAAMYDEIIRVPFIIKWPLVIRPDTVYKDPVSHIDIAPTIMEAKGMKIPKLLEGRSLMPAMEDLDTRVNEYVFTEFTRFEIDHDSHGGFQPIRAVFDGRHKLVINLMTSDELYDLEEDPWEMENLIECEKYTKIRDKLHDKILEWMNDTRDPFRGYYWELRRWRKDAKPASWKYTGFTRQREHEEYEPRELDYNTGVEIVEAARKSHPYTL